MHSHHSLREPQAVRITRAALAGLVLVALLAAAFATTVVGGGHP